MVFGGGGEGYIFLSRSVMQDWETETWDKFMTCSLLKKEGKRSNQSVKVSKCEDQIYFLRLDIIIFLERSLNIWQIDGPRFKTAQLKSTSGPMFRTWVNSCSFCGDFATGFNKRRDMVCQALKSDSKLDWFRLNPHRDSAFLLYSCNMVSALVARRLKW